MHSGRLVIRMGRTKVTSRKKAHSKGPDYFRRIREKRKQLEKEKFKVFKRHRYNDYITDFQTCDACYDEWEREAEDPEYQAPGIRELSRRTGIPIASISRWHSLWLVDHSYRNYNYEAKGTTKRIFTVEEEQSIAEFIRSNVIKAGVYFTDEDFRDLIMNAYLLKYLDEDSIPRDFRASNGFIWDFKRRNHFSSRKSHYKRRTESSPAFIEEWKRQVAEVFANVPLDHILNCDETSWKTYPNGLRTWADRGARDVQVRIGGSEKQCMTVLATVCADGTKRPLMFLAEGKKDGVLTSQLGDVGPHWKTRSESGWITGENFKDYLSCIRQHQYDDEPIHILCDVYSAHHTEEVKQHAKALNIVLHFVPAGTTDFLQPLDRRIFACVKACVKRLFRMKQREVGFGVVDLKKQDSVQMMIWSWEHLGSEVIKDAWSIYQDENE